MATGVKYRDEESSLTKADLETIQDAMKSKKFREMLSEYCEEIRDPANQAIYQKEMTQLEKERGYDVTFINPKGSYVIKTSVAGDRKAFINICSNENVDKPSCSVQEKNGQKGMNWQLPYTIIPPREDLDYKRQRCVIYDVVFHPDTLRMAAANIRFRELVNNTAFEGLQKTYNIHFDSNNCRFPKSYYKGMTTPAVIRKEDPNYKPPTNEEDDENISPEIMEKLYPQHIYPEANEPVEEHKKEPTQHRKKAKNSKKEFSHCTDNGYTVPKYVIKQQKNIDLQDFTYNKDSKQYSAIPTHIVVEINLPLLSSTKDCVLDVREKSLNLVSEKPAKYKLNITLPYAVDDENGNAKFDKSKHTLFVSLPVTKRNTYDCNVLLRSDSGVESEENSNDEEESKENLIEVISSSPTDSKLSLLQNDQSPPSEELFLLSTVSYTLPPYTFNVLDDVVAFTFHVKNTEPNSVKVKSEGNKIQMKFSTLGSGFVPIHYAALILFDKDVKFENVIGEAWDNNVILQLEIVGAVIDKFQIGLSEDELKTEFFDVSLSTKDDAIKVESPIEGTTPLVEVTNLGTETNIVVSSPNSKIDTEEEDENENNIVWTESINTHNGAKSILRKSIMMRSFSESSVGDVASSMDYISSDYIPEESSLKKTVRFSDVIARQFYRYNSSIEGQKKKNQRKKSKKRNQERRRSESEAEDDISNLVKPSKPRLKSALKQRHDSGLADTSDADECKTNMSDSDVHYHSNTDENTIEDGYHSRRKASYLNVINNNSEKQNGVNLEKNEPITSENIKHNTDLYNPDKLNKGQYLEVKFKNDLIFDLDM